MNPNIAKFGSLQLTWHGTDLGLWTTPRVARPFGACIIAAFGVHLFVREPLTG